MCFISRFYIFLESQQALEIKVSRLQQVLNDVAEEKEETEKNYNEAMLEKNRLLDVVDLKDTELSDHNNAIAKLKVLVSDSEREKATFKEEMNMAKTAYERRSEQIDGQSWELVKSLKELQKENVKITDEKELLLAQVRDHKDSEVKNYEMIDNLTERMKEVELRRKEEKGELNRMEEELRRTGIEANEVKLELEEEKGALLLKIEKLEEDEKRNLISMEAKYEELKEKQVSGNLSKSSNNDTMNEENEKLQKNVRELETKCLELESHLSFNIYEPSQSNSSIEQKEPPTVESLQGELMV